MARLYSDHKPCLYPEVTSLISPLTTLSVPQASWCPDTLGISLPQGLGPCPPLCLHDLHPNLLGLSPFLRLASTFQWALPRPLWKNFSILPTLPTFLASFSVFFAFTCSIIYHTMLDPWRTWELGGANPSHSQNPHVTYGWPSNTHGFSVSPLRNPQI